MKQEGVSDKIVDAVLGKEADVGKGSDHASLANANSTKTIAFHWTTSNLAPELLEQSIFGRTELFVEFDNVQTQHAPPPIS